VPAQGGWAIGVINSQQRISKQEGHTYLPWSGLPFFSFQSTMGSRVIHDGTVKQRDGWLPPEDEMSARVVHVEVWPEEGKLFVWVDGCDRDAWVDPAKGCTVALPRGGSPWYPCVALCCFYAELV